MGNSSSITKKKIQKLAQFEKKDHIKTFEIESTKIKYNLRNLKVGDFFTLNIKNKKYFLSEKKFREKFLKLITKFQDKLNFRTKESLILSFLKIPELRKKIFLILKKNCFLHSYRFIIWDIILKEKKYKEIFLKENVFIEKERISNPLPFLKKNIFLSEIEKIEKEKRKYKDFENFGNFENSVSEEKRIVFLSKNELECGDCGNLGDFGAKNYGEFSIFFGSKKDENFTNKNLKRKSINLEYFEKFSEKNIKHNEEIIININSRKNLQKYINKISQENKIENSQKMISKMQQINIAKNYQEKNLSKIDQENQENNKKNNEENNKKNNQENFQENYQKKTQKNSSEKIKKQTETPKTEKPIKKSFRKLSEILLKKHKKPFTQKNIRKLSEMLYKKTLKKNAKINIITYQRLLSQNSPKLELDIKKDISRTLTSKKIFTKKNLIPKKKLFNICKAVGLYFSKTGYVQGMNFIIGFILCVNGFDEFGCFSFITNLFVKKKNLYFGIFSENFPVLKFLVFGFYDILEISNFKVFKKLKKIGFFNELWITKWFLSFFVVSFENEFLLRIFDFLVLKDIFGLIFICVILVEQFEKIILKEDFENLSLFFGNKQKIKNSLDFEKFSKDLGEVDFDVKFKKKILEKYFKSLRDLEKIEFEFFYRNFKDYLQNQKKPSFKEDAKLSFFV